MDRTLIPTPFEDASTSEQMRMLLSFNPLRNLNARAVDQILDFSENGCISRLQLIYRMLEKHDINVGIINSRRRSAIIGCDWEIRKRDNASKTPELERLADEQVAFLNENFARAEDTGTLLEAILTLASAIFRGIAVVEPRFSNRGLEKFECFDSWNFCVTPGTDHVYWNPSGLDVIDFEKKLKRIDGTNAIISLEETPIDAFVLPIYIRSAFGEEAWSKLIARRGLPNCIVVAPPIANDKLTEFTAAARKVADGGNGALPNGSEVHTEKTDPGNSQAFEMFLAHQQKQVVLIGTGGVLGSLAEATGLGSGVSDFQNQTWREIIKSDVFKISNLIHRHVAKKLLDAAFPGQEQLAYFTIDASTPKSATEVLDCAVKASQAGLAIDPVQLSEMTGFKISKAPQAQQNPISVASDVPSVASNSEDDKTIEQKDEVPPSASEEKEEKEPEVVENVEPTEPKEEVKQKASLLKAFDTVINPIRSLVGKLFNAKSFDEEKQILEDINALTKKIEQQDENEYIAAVQNMMEKETNEQRT